MAGEGSARQVRALVFAAMLAPMAALPGLTARAAGTWGWLIPVAAIPPAMLGLILFRSLGPEGLAARLIGGWGPPGRAAVALYYLWAMGEAALTVGSCVDRLGRTDYGGLSPWLLSLALGAVVWYLTARGRAAFLRTAKLFFLVMAGLLLLIGVLGLWAADWSRMTDLPTDRAPGMADGLLPVLGALSVGALGAFFPRKREERPRLWAPVGWCLAAALLCAVVIGIMGGTLAGELPLPLFLALQGIGVPGGFRRLEALGTAAWVLSDLALFGMAALAGKTMTGDRRWGAWPVLLAGVLGGGLLSPDRAAPWAETILWVQLAFGAGIPALLRLTGRKRDRGTEE